MIQFIINFLKSFWKPMPQPTIVVPQPPQPPPMPVPQPITLLPREKLYLMAKLYLGTDASPNDLAPDEFGCMETVDDIYFKALKTYINGTTNKVTLSTGEGLKIFLANPHRFREVMTATPGSIVIAATGTQAVNSPLSNGHIAIAGKFGLMSNNSATGKFEENYTLDSFTQHYKIIGKFPIHIFEPL